MTGKPLQGIEECAGLSLDRVCPPLETVSRLRPHFHDLGITRLARQTGLDTLGIPCFSAIRPNAKTLSASQGKGLDDASAMASAVMEAAEFAIAERLPPIDWSGPAQALESMGVEWFEPSRLVPFGEKFDVDRPISWVAGKSLFGRRPTMIPRDVVRFDGLAPELHHVSQNTNGLASGNTAGEAEFHALCELIERDATTLFTMLPPEAKAKLAVSCASFLDPAIADLARRAERAGLRLQLFDLTSDIGVPTIMALLGPSSTWRYFDLAVGYGTHPVAALAAIRAITEAAQSRITSIAGARDDIPPAQYADSPDGLAADLLDHPALHPPPSGLPPSSTFAERYAFLRGAIKYAGIDEPVAVPLGGDCFGISVVRLVSGILEDREANSNWRPGPRAVATLLEVA
ncbi:MAG: YcaO-like family protein [Devosia sp.]